MKKLLLSLFMSIVACMGAIAQTTVTASQLGEAIGGAKEISGYTFDIEKNNGSTAPMYHEGTNALRIYAKGTLAISGTKLTKVVFTLASDAAGRYTTFEPSAGALNPAQAAGDTQIVWEGDATAVTFTVGDKATMGTDGASKAGQIRLASVEVYGEGGGDTPVDPDPVELVTTKVANIGAWLVSADPSELYEFENPVTVVYQNGFNTYVQDETGSMFIYGSIPAYTPGQQIPAGFVGNYKDYYSTIELVIPNDDTKDACVATYKAGVDGTMPAPAEVAISAIDGETMGNKYIKLAGVTVSALDGKNFTITQGEATIAGFNKFGVEVANTEEGKTVDVIGLVNWYTAKGATEPTASIYPIEIVAQGGTPVDPDPDKTIILSTDFDANDGFTFEDGTLPEGLTYVWTRDSKYNYMKASCFKSGNHAVEGAFLVSPVLDLTNRNEITLTFNQALGFCTAEQAAEMLSLWVREENMDWSVELPIQAWPAAVEGKNFTAFESAGEYDLDQFKNKKIQLGWKYTSTTEVGPTWEIDAVKVTGKIDNAISDIEADVNAPVEYFNLQGVRVANPENGLYIMRQGNKVTKVIR